MRIISMGERGLALQETPVERDPSLLSTAGARTPPRAEHADTGHQPGGSWIAVLFLIAVIFGTFGIAILLFLWH